jgi:hypothetical protein
MARPRSRHCAHGEGVPAAPASEYIGDRADEFLYANRIEGGGIELRAGVAFCLRRFHGLVEDMVRGAWVRFVRRVKANHAALGQATDIDEFLFGSERADLSFYRPILRNVQGDHCFYCDGGLRDAAHVDHFIPWARYPVDLGHNFVLAHEACNNSKRDMLAAPPHLERWCRRNADCGDDVGAAFLAAGLPSDLAASRRITRWAYQQAEATGAHVWLYGSRRGSLSRLAQSGGRCRALRGRCYA